MLQTPISRATSVLLIVILVSLGFTIGCGGQSQVSKPLRVTINSWIGWAPLYLASEKGLYNGTTLDIVRVEDTGARKSTMISGEVDGYASSVDNFALDAAQGVPGKIVLCFDESHGADGVVVKKSIATVDELRGKKVGFQKGLPSHFLLLSILRRAGLKPSEIEQIDMDADKAGAAFVAGHLDAAVTWEPWISKAASMADGKVLVTTADFPGLIVDVLVVRDEVLQNRHRDVTNLVLGWFSALEYWKAHKEEADLIMAKAYGIPVADFQAMCTGVRFYDQAKNVEYMTSNTESGINSVFQSASALWISSGIIDSKVNPAMRIDTTFVTSKRQAAQHR